MNQHFCITTPHPNHSPNFHTGACDVSKESVDWLLGKSGPGNAVVIVIGGATESLEAQPHEYVVYLSKRKGFVRKALQHG